MWPYTEVRELLCDDASGYESPTILYRYFDASGALLYIGVSNDLTARDAAHRKSSPWRYDAAFARVELFPARSLAECAECYVIREEKPPHNSRLWGGGEPGLIYNWFMHKVGGLRGERPIWLAAGFHGLTECHQPEWWDDARLFVYPYNGGPAEPRKKPQAAKSDVVMRWTIDEWLAYDASRPKRGRSK